MISFVRCENLVEPITVRLHSDDGKNSRLGCKILILKCEVVY